MKLSRGILTIAAACFVIGSSQLVKAVDVDPETKVKIKTLYDKLKELHTEREVDDGAGGKKKVTDLDDARFKALEALFPKKADGSVDEDAEWKFDDAKKFFEAMKAPADPTAIARSAFEAFFKKATETEMSWFKKMYTLEFLFSNSFWNVWDKSNWAKDHKTIVKVGTAAVLCGGLGYLGYRYADKKFQDKAREDLENDADLLARYEDLEKAFRDAKDDAERQEIIEQAVARISSDATFMQKLSSAFPFAGE